MAQGTGLTPQTDTDPMAKDWWLWGWGITCVAQRSGWQHPRPWGHPWVTPPAWSCRLPGVQVSLCPQCQPWPGPGPQCTQGREERNGAGDDPALTGAGREGSGVFRPRLLAETCHWPAQGVTGQPRVSRRAPPHWDPAGKSHLLAWVSPVPLWLPGNRRGPGTGLAGGLPAAVARREGEEGADFPLPCCRYPSPRLLLCLGDGQRQPGWHKGWTPPQCPVPSSAGDPELCPVPSSAGAGDSSRQQGHHLDTHIFYSCKHHKSAWLLFP